ncbi:hypothetical protein LG293_16290 (plasmid) [Citricoccus nitrophenolicus]
MSESHTGAIGVVGLDDLPAILKSLGVDVIARSDFNESAKEINNTLKRGPIPVVVRDSRTPGLKPWTDRIANKFGAKVIILRDPLNPILDSLALDYIDLPTTVNDILSVAEMAPVSGGSRLITGGMEAAPGRHTTNGFRQMIPAATVQPGAHPRQHAPAPVQHAQPAPVQQQQQQQGVPQYQQPMDRGPEQVTEAVPFQQQMPSVPQRWVDPSQHRAAPVAETVPPRSAAPSQQMSQEQSWNTSEDDSWHTSDPSNDGDFGVPQSSGLAQPVAQPPEQPGTPDWHAQAQSPAQSGTDEWGTDWHTPSQGEMQAPAQRWNTTWSAAPAQADGHAQPEQATPWGDHQESAQTRWDAPAPAQPEQGFFEGEDAAQGWSTEAPAQQFQEPVQQQQFQQPAQAQQGAYEWEDPAQDWSTEAPAQQFQEPVQQQQFQQPAQAQQGAYEWEDPAQDWSTEAPVQQFQEPVQQQQFQQPAQAQQGAYEWEDPAQGWNAEAPAQQFQQQQQQQFQEPAQQWAPHVTEPATAAPGNEGWATPSRHGQTGWEQQESAPAPSRQEAQGWENSPSTNPHRPTWETQQAENPGPGATEIFDAQAADRFTGTGRNGMGLGSLVISFSGKGGVGKSTNAIALARMASEAGLKTILIDGNSGQGDLITYLRLTEKNLPTIYDAAITGDPRRAVLSPDEINRHRTPQQGHVSFGFVAAPPEEIANASVVTNSVYAAVIEFCRKQADLVVLDTQILESDDKTGVIGTVLLPALLGDAWGLGISDMSTTGVNNLNNRLVKLVRDQVPTDRLMLAFNRIDSLDEEPVVDQVAGRLTSRASYVGYVLEDRAIKGAMKSGVIDPRNEMLDSMASKVLYRVTGNDVFRRMSETPPSTHQGKARKGFMATLMGMVGGKK